jgi:hypothetical protein
MLPVSHLICPQFKHGMIEKQEIGSLQAGPKFFLVIRDDVLQFFWQLFCHPFAKGVMCIDAWHSELPPFRFMV